LPPPPPSFAGKPVASKDGRVRDGKPFSKTTLSQFLRNPIFTGNVIHRGQIYPGEHRGIIRKAMIEKLHEILPGNQKTRPNNWKTIIRNHLHKTGAIDYLIVLKLPNFVGPF